MSDEVKTDDVREEVVETENFTKEQVEKMIADAVKESLVKHNSEFQKKLSEVKKEKEEALNGKLSIEEENRKMLESLIKERDIEKWRSKSIKAYSDAGLTVPDDDVIADMIRLESDDPLRVVNYTIKNASELMKKKKEGEFLDDARANAVKPRDSNVKIQDGKSIHDYTESELKKMPTDVFNKLFEAERNK